jgi:hypothetical protein
MRALAFRDSGAGGDDSCGTMKKPHVKTSTRPPPTAAEIHAWANVKVRDAVRVALLLAASEYTLLAELEKRR